SAQSLSRALSPAPAHSPSLKTENFLKRRFAIRCVCSWAADSNSQMKIEFLKKENSNLLQKLSEIAAMNSKLLKNSKYHRTSALSHQKVTKFLEESKTQPNALVGFSKIELYISQNQEVRQT